MGLLADFYIAEKANAALYSETQECDEADRVQSGDITTLQLSMLAAVLEGREWQVEMMDAFEQILVDGDGE